MLLNHTNWAFKAEFRVRLCDPLLSKGTRRDDLITRASNTAAVTTMSRLYKCVTQGEGKRGQRGFIFVDHVLSRMPDSDRACNSRSAVTLKVLRVTQSSVQGSKGTITPTEDIIKTNQRDRHGSEVWKGHKWPHVGDQLGEDSQDGCRADCAREIYAPAPECRSGVCDKLIGRSFWEPSGQGTFPPDALCSGPLWPCAQLLGIQVQHLRQQ